MRRSTVVLAVLVALLVGALVNVSPAQAQVNAADVAQLTPFTPEANYMSLPGYLRWQVFVEEGRWITMLQALRQIKAQGINPPWPAEAVAYMLKQEKEGK